MNYWTYCSFLLVSSFIRGAHQWGEQSKWMKYSAQCVNKYHNERIVMLIYDSLKQYIITEFVIIYYILNTVQKILRNLI